MIKELFSAVGEAVEEWCEHDPFMIVVLGILSITIPITIALLLFFAAVFGR